MCLVASVWQFSHTATQLSLHLSEQELTPRRDRRGFDAMCEERVPAWNTYYGSVVCIVAVVEKKRRIRGVDREGMVTRGADFDLLLGLVGLLLLDSGDVL